MTNKEILRIFMEQSALDLNCSPDDFMRNDHVVVVNSKLGPSAKKYYKEPITCFFVSYGSNIVASVKEEYHDIAAEYINKFEHSHCFRTPNIHWLDEKLAEKGQKVCFMAEYFLPDINKLRPLPCDYEMSILDPPDFADLYRPEWRNALTESRRELDMLGVGAYDGDRLIGLAGCSADCERMWQIGVDVLPEYRERRIGAALTSRLAIEIFERGKVPFYGCVWSNIRSAGNAVKSGFVPAWAEMNVTPKEKVDELNR